MITIRQATAADVPAILPMAFRFLHETSFGKVIPGDVTPASLGPFIELILARGVGFVAERTAAPELRTPPTLVGFIAAIIAPHPMSGVHYTDEIAWWVEPEHRSGRTGIHLFRAIEQWTRQCGVSCLKMVAPADSTVGKFLQHRGYTAVETAYVKLL